MKHITENEQVETKPIIIASIHSETGEKRNALYLVEYIGNSTYQWHEINEGELTPLESLPITSDIDQAVQNAYELLGESTGSCNIVIASESLTEAILEEWPNQDIIDLGPVELLEQKKNGEALWFFPKANAPFWVVEGATGTCVVSRDSRVTEE